MIALAHPISDLMTQESGVQSCSIATHVPSPAIDVFQSTRSELSFMAGPP
jgi:hypothetical protein